MATLNPFDLLGDDDNDDPSQLIASYQQKMDSLKASAAAVEAPAKFPSKPIPPSKAVAEAKKEAAAAAFVPRGGGRGGGGGGGHGRGGRGSGAGWDFKSNGNINGFSGGENGSVENGDVTMVVERGRGSYGAPRQPYRGGRRGGYANGDVGRDPKRPPLRQFNHRRGDGNENGNVKKDGAGDGNNGVETDEVFTQKADVMAKTEDKALIPEKQDDILIVEANNKDNEGVEVEGEKKEVEDKEMTLAEYQKILEEKRKALVALKSEERKVDLDKDFESMQQLSLKKGNDKFFIKLGTDKDAAKRKEDANRDEKTKKSVTINEFLKPAEGERYYNPRGRRGRGRGDYTNPRGNFGGLNTSSPAAPSIENSGEFPPLK